MFFDWERKMISQIDVLSNVKPEKEQKSEKSSQQSE